jgi:hypothetical protein
VRLVGDPGSSIDDPLARRDDSLRALASILPLTMSQALQPMIDFTLRLNLPAGDEAMQRYIEGVTWIGAGIAMPGVAVYVDATKGDRDEQRQRTETWLRTIVRDPWPALRTLESMPDGADLMAAGLEGFAPENARVKFFWRMPRAMTLAELGPEGLQHPSLVRFLTMAMKDRALPISAFVFSNSFLVANGMPFDVKVDLCAHCLDLDNTAWEALVAEVTSEFSLSPMNVSAALANGRSQPAFIGFNVSPMGHRLDLFLRPSAWYGEVVVA